MDFTQLIDLAAARTGGKALATNDEFFAPKENLLKAAKAVWIADKYTTKGKWMDGWESRRRRTPGHDWCEIKLGLRGVIRGVDVDTRFFTGNYPSHASLEARDGSGAWVELLPKSELKGDGDNLFPIASDKPFTHVRLNIFPDGGVARLRVYGAVVPDWAKTPKKALIDLAAVENGGLPLLSSDQFYSHPQNLIMPGRAKNMGDGWETKRRRGPGHDWTILRLGAAGTLREIEVDTNHFKGNYPDSCMIEGVHRPNAAPEELADEFTPWVSVLPQTKLAAHTRHVFKKQIVPHGPITHVRLNIYPDGGVSRLRLRGEARVTVDELNRLPEPRAREELERCCGASRWVDMLLKCRPFKDKASVFSHADATWAAMLSRDWLDAFSHHPRIGGKDALREKFATTKEWAQGEQASVAAADEATLDALAQGNVDYEDKFGFIFIVCATGKSAAEMLALLQARLPNDGSKELKIAAAEQVKITNIRLEKLLT